MYILYILYIVEGHTAYRYNPFNFEDTPSKGVSAHRKASALESSSEHHLPAPCAEEALAGACANNEPLQGARTKESLRVRDLQL